MTEALITPELIKWARERCSLTADKVAGQMNVSVTKFNAWETGEERPTFRQAQNLAQKLSVPFGYFFLSTLPSESLPLPDLRTVAGTPRRAPSPEFSDLLKDVLLKQEWYREYQEAEGAAPVPFVGRYTLSDSPEMVAAGIRDTLGISDDMRRESRNWEDFLTKLIRRAESTGILVLRSGIVGNNTHRTLKVTEFRGFAITDDLAPLVFVNARDAKAAQIFTVAHELAHLWLGESGVSNPDYLRLPNQQQNRVDQFCDRVAAEVLLPNANLLSRWRENESIESNLQSLAIQYRVSKFVVLRRAYENNKLSATDYANWYEKLLAQGAVSGFQGGGNFYSTLLARNSNTLAVALMVATAEGRVPRRDAARLLNVKMKTLNDVYNRLLGSGSSNA